MPSADAISIFFFFYQKRSLKNGTKFDTKSSLHFSSTVYMSPALEFCSTSELRVSSWNPKNVSEESKSLETATNSKF